MDVLIPLSDQTDAAPEQRGVQCVCVWHWAQVTGVYVFANMLQWDIQFLPSQQIISD